MKRVINENGVVHFRCTDRLDRTICGESAGKDLLGDEREIGVETSRPVTCEKCATVYCDVKNAPWNEIDRNVLISGMYMAMGVDYVEA